ncbi:hypothetical protein JOF53_007090 [Crossiella equi]|uniref:Uncharacterized protein n=1 Tax=Crossiella equi TaxID=130796 RepID=A0ABS5ANS4_9PSEU|nr:hypothetical protein [Crossiella equi]MBP2478218.1 hypothetical protein [Crossiella equi]
MSDLDCWADLVATGAVLGADEHTAPHVLDELFDEDNSEHVAQVSTNALTVHYGPLEFVWERTGEDAPWRGTQLTAHIDNLAFEWTGVPELLHDTYGVFAGHPPFEELRAELARRDIPLVEVPSPVPGCRSHWQPDSLAVVTEVVGGEDELVTAAAPIGSVAAITAPGWLYDMDRPRFDALLAGLREPEDGSDDPAWWRDRLHVLRVRLGWREPDQDAWVARYLRLTARAALPGVEVAEHVATTAARLGLYDGERPEGLPAPAALTEVLLAGIPVTRAEAEERWGVPGLHGAEVRPLLRARRLVLAAAGLAPHMPEQAELEEWLAVWPELRRDEEPGLP